MSLKLHEGVLCAYLEPRLEKAEFRQGLANLAGDPFFLAFFLASVSQGEGLGEKAVGMIGEEEIASLIEGLAVHEAEERVHKERTIEAARRLFPEFFEGDRYRYEGALQGRPYYVAVLEANRARLKELGRYSRLNLYFTTTFGYEVMVVLLYRAVADAVAASSLPASVRQPVSALLEQILEEEGDHLAILAQHDELLEAPRDGLSPAARDLLDQLEKLTEDDYVFVAERAVRQVVEMITRYADPPRYRAEIEMRASSA